MPHLGKRLTADPHSLKGGINPPLFFIIGMDAFFLKSRQCQSGLQGQSLHGLLSSVIVGIGEAIDEPCHLLFGAHLNREGFRCRDGIGLQLGIGGGDPERVFPVWQPFQEKFGGYGRAVGLKSGEADRQRVEERTRQNS